MSKTRDEYIKLYQNEIKNAENAINEIRNKRMKEINEGKIPNSELDSEESKQRKIINKNTQLLNAMGIKSVDE